MKYNEEHPPVPAIEDGAVTVKIPDELTKK
jgi:hypothetical protein